VPHNASFPDRHLEMAEALRDVLADTLPPAASVNRSYAPDWAKVPPAGKTVWLLPTTEQDAERMTRRRVLTEYGFGGVIAERYPDALRPTGQEPVPDDWVDERCGWVRANVYEPLNDAVRRRDRLIPTAWPQTCRLALKYSVDRLAAGVFWSEVEVTFREEREA
jgi:hypothetical protein